MSYMAFLCYHYDDNEPVIKFEHPEQWKYEKVIPIQFSVLHGWTNQDKGLYK